MEKEGWKILAIIFIVLSIILFIILVIESIAFVFVLAYEQELDDKEAFCDLNICSQFDNYSSYTFDEYEDICYCYDRDGENIHTEFVNVY